MRNFICKKIFFVLMAGRSKLNIYYLIKKVNKQVIPNQSTTHTPTTIKNQQNKLKSKYYLLLICNCSN